MRGALFLPLLVASWTHTVVAGEPPQPLEVSWSNEVFGPDGPWQAVQVSIGSNQQHIALYPGGTWASNILLPSICKVSTSSCYANKAGLFESGLSSTFDDTSIEYLINNGEFGQMRPFGAAGEVPLWGVERYALDTAVISGYTVPNFDMLAISHVYQSYPEANFPVEVGTLSLGTDNFNQTFGDIANPINVTFVNSYLYTQGIIPSYSYGLHIGSAALNIPGSLILGGYDKSRIVGNVSAQSFIGSSFPIALLDVEIGVASGGSPWPYRSKTGFLAEGNSSIKSSTTVYASPPDPYIYLPQSSCDAIAAQLPVTYQAAYGLYFWNTSDPMYSKIVSSPSYLGFVFSQNSLNTANLTIKVPFALLNLILEPPLVSSRTPYFPCMGTDGTYALGRAFLQAAFIGVNWADGTGNWFLAQAPGPNLPGVSSPTVINSTQDTLPGTQSHWEDTWKGFWTVLPNNTSTTNPVHTSGGGLTTGAKAGIGVGCAAAVVLAILAGWWFFSRRGRKYMQAQSCDSVTEAPVQTMQESHTPRDSQFGSVTDSNYHSLAPDGPVQMYELPHVNPDAKGPYELDQ